MSRSDRPRDLSVPSGSGSGSSGSISSSFLGLKAELERSKASQSSSTSKRKSHSSQIGLDAKTTKKLSSAFLDPSSTKKLKRDKLDGGKEAKRSSSRLDSSSALGDPTRSQLERIRRNLERKARIYDQLSAGKYGGRTLAELKEGSIDWERKLAEPHAAATSRSPSPTSLHDDRGDEQELEVEYTDEFGRSRRAKLNDIPREHLPPQYAQDYNQIQEPQQDTAIYGPSSSFPVYHPERAAKRSIPDVETRHRGPAFYKFSTEQDQRRQQMDQLAELRRETLDKRREQSSQP